jgi:ABC-2 type transport system ATP-binding protein
MIRNMAQEKAIILSTHILDEMDAVCTRAIIIANGRIVADETPDNLRKQSSFHGAVTLAVSGEDSKQLIACLENVPGIKSVEILSAENNCIRVRVFPESGKDSITETILAELKKNRYTVQSTFVEQGRLDEVFRAITTQAAMEQDVSFKKKQLTKRLRTLPDLRSQHLKNSE